MPLRKFMWKGCVYSCVFVGVLMCDVPQCVCVSACTKIFRYWLYYVHFVGHVCFFVCACMWLGLMAFACGQRASLHIDTIHFISFFFFFFCKSWPEPKSLLTPHSLSVFLMHMPNIHIAVTLKYAHQFSFFSHTVPSPQSLPLLQSVSGCPCVFFQYSYLSVW